MARLLPTKSPSLVGGGGGGASGEGSPAAGRLPPLTAAGHAQTASGELLPRCAAVVPKRYKIAERQAKGVRRRLREEELGRLDFHGFGGNVVGLRAFLAHKYGSAARGWRRAFAPDPPGTQPVTFNEFCRALQRIGWSGQALTLWRSLSRETGGVTAALEDLEPELGRQLDEVAKLWCDTFNAGGVYEAWSDLQREHAGRANFDEVALFFDDMDLIPADRFNMRKVFDVLDVHAIGTVTREDLRFLDHWAARRLDVPLPEEELLEKEEEEPWSPPPPKVVEPPGVAEFRVFLEQRYGSAARAWRVVLDCKGTGFLLPSDFGMGCRQAGWTHPHGPLWRELQEAGGGLVTLRALDPETAEAIDSLNDAVRMHGRFEDIHAFWEELVDPGGTGAVSASEFVAGVARELGLDAATARRVFLCLDTQNTGWVAVTEIGFLDLFQAERPNLEGTIGSRSASVGSSHPGPVPIASPAASSYRSQSGGGGGDTSESTQSRMGGIGLGRPSPLSMSLSTGNLSSPMQSSMHAARPTRSALQRSYSQSHASKHRWLSTASLQRCLHSSKEWPPTKKYPWTKDRDVFRSSSEFYREGLRLLTGGGAAQSLPADDDDQDDD